MIIFPATLAVIKAYQFLKEINIKSTRLEQVSGFDGDGFK